MSLRNYKEAVAEGDRLSKGEVVDAFGEDGGGHIKNFGLYLRRNGKPFVCFLRGTYKNKKIFHPFVYLLFFWGVGVGSTLPLGQDHICLVYHCIPSTSPAENQYVS